MKRFLAILAIVSLTGCASHLSQQQCLSTNWYAVGENDGTAGKQPANLANAIKDCEKFKLTVNTGAYMSGWHQGMRQYCSPAFETGYADGMNGAALSTVDQRGPLCAQAQLTLKTDKYHTGWSSGIKSYCTYENGMNIARQGQAEPMVCPPGLAARFNAGWHSGQSAFCDNPANGFALGRDGKAYPGICTASLFVGFRSEYDRGMTIHNAVNDRQDRISALNDSIRSTAFRYDLQENGLEEYRPGNNTSPEAMRALQDVNHMVREKRNLENQLLALQVTR